MIIYPAIDIRGGKCVRLIEGRLDQETVYSDDPVGMAQHWERLGAEWLHLVDLDGAFSGQLQNLAIIQDIVRAVKIPVQLGGGIRTMNTIEMLLKTGVSRVILGTAAVSDLSLVAEAAKKFEESVMVGIDSKNGFVAIQGWEEPVDKTYLDLGREIKDLGIKRVVFTDIRRDGTLQGPNIEAAEKLAKESGLRVIVSGGVSSLEDICKVKHLELSGLEGVIIGKALYAETIDLREAIRVGKGEMN